MDRDAIERRDFPVGRRGYDQEAVDEHLRRIADEFETLRAPAPAPAGLAAGASEQVRLILEAAEASAAELRADAGRQAEGHVARVQDAAGSMLSRLDELERELGTLLAALRQSGEHLNEGLARLHRQAGELGAAAGDDGAAASSGDDSVASSGAAGDDVGRSSGTAAGDDVGPSSGAAAGDVVGRSSGAGDDTPGEIAPIAAGNGAPATDEEAGARLIALNMALSGAPREETARYLAEHFSLADADALLDDVYDRAGR